VVPSTTTTLPLPAIPFPITPLAPANAHLTISSTDISFGKRVSVTGTGCPVGYFGQPLLYDVGPDDPAIFRQTGDHFDAESLFQTTNGFSGMTVGHDGIWTMHGTVPMVPPGPAMLAGRCSPMSDGGVGDPVFYYRAISVKMVTSPYGLKVDPGTTVAAGTLLTVTSVGGNCWARGSFPDVSLFSPSYYDVADGTGPTTSEPWKSVLTVPSGLKPGHYRLEADCVDVYSVTGSYAPVVITVR
jgi:hypothetical protein